MKNADRKGRKLGAYGRRSGSPLFVTFLTPLELAELEEDSRPATALEQVITRALLDFPIEELH